MEKLRQILRGPAGIAALVVVLCLSLWGAYVGARELFGESRLAANARDRVFIDAENGKSFHYTIKVGDVYPVKSPYTGKNTGYPAEFCYWTADGKVKKDPTPVLMNTYVGKKGPTFCPDCGRLVVSFNPMAAEGQTPPPKESEYKPRQRGPRQPDADGQDPEKPQNEE